MLFKSSAMASLACANGLISGPKAREPLSLLAETLCCDDVKGI
jgi:hypothetical protein